MLNVAPYIPGLGTNLVTGKTNWTMFLGSEVPSPTTIGQSQSSEVLMIRLCLSVKNCWCYGRLDWIGMVVLLKSKWNICCKK